MSARTTTRHLVVVATAIAIMGGAASCGGDDTGDLPPPASPPAATDQAPGLDLSPAEQQAVDEALAKFDEFMNAYIQVSTTDIPPVDEGEDLFAQVDQHVAGQLSPDLRREIVGRWVDGQVVDRAWEWSFSAVVVVDLEREVDGVRFPQVQLEHCIDASGSVVVDVRTGEPAEELDGRRLWRYAVSWSDDWGGLQQGREGWRVTDREELESQPC